MSTAGKIVVTAAGKRGLHSSGKAASFNSQGDCPECCSECPLCSDDVPHTYEVVFSGIQACCCNGIWTNVGQPWKITDTAQVNNAFTLTRYLYTDPRPVLPEETISVIRGCIWVSPRISISSSSYYGGLGGGCASVYTSGTSYGAVILCKTGATAWKLFIAAYDSAEGPKYIFHSSIAGQPSKCDVSLAFSNDQTSCDGVVPGFNGSATASVP